MKSLKILLTGLSLMAFTAFGFNHLSIQAEAQSTSLDCQYDDDGCVNPRVKNICGCETDPIT